MFIRVLGAAAGGGYPQWNCNHPNSRLARNKNLNATKCEQCRFCLPCPNEIPIPEKLSTPLKKYFGLMLIAIRSFKLKVFNNSVVKYP